MIKYVPCKSKGNIIMLTGEKIKPVFTIESGRWSSVYNSEKYKDVHNVGFEVNLKSNSSFITFKWEPCLIHFKNIT